MGFVGAAQKIGAMLSLSKHERAISLSRTVGGETGLALARKHLRQIIKG